MNTKVWLWSSLPILVCFSISVTTLLLWKAIVNQDLTTRKRLLELTATSVKHEINTQMQNRFQVLARMSQRWTSRGGTPKNEWEVDAQNYIRDYAGFQAIEWIDSDFYVRWIVPLAGNEEALNLNLAFEPRRKVALETARQKDTITVTKTINLVQGGKGFLVYVPIFLNTSRNKETPNLKQNSFDGFILGVFRIQSLLDTIVDKNLAASYVITIFEGEQEIYSRNFSENSQQIKIPWVEKEIIFEGVTWKLKIWSTTESLNSEQSLLAKLVLNGGLMIAVIAALAVYLAQTAIKSESTNRAIVNSIPDLMIRAKADGSYLEFFGQKHSQYIYNLKKDKLGDSVQESLPPNLAEKQLKFIQQALTTRKLQVYEHQFIVNGQTRFEEVRIIFLRADELLIIVRDITAGKQAEQALEKANQKLEQKVAERTASLAESQRTLTTLMSNLPGMAYRCENNENWDMIFVSQGCYSLTDYLPEDFINHKTVEYSQIIHPEDRDKVWQEVQKALLKKEAFQLIYRLFTKKGIEKWVWEQGQGIFNSEDQIEFIEGFITDISDLIRTEQALKESNQELRNTLTKLKETQKDLQIAIEKAESANVAKSEFLANMSHELRTPLNSIIGFTQILGNDSFLTAEQRKRLSIINLSGEHLLSLINNILEMSKIEAGRINLHETSFDIFSLFENLQEMFDLKLRNKRLQLLLELDSDLPQYISTDEAKLRQVLINLIDNAIKFTDKGRIILRAQVKPHKIDRKSLLKIEVEDTGMGISPNELDKLFIPFEQTSSGRKIKQGTGLGLFISYKFVELMGGELTAKSRLNFGTCFQFSLPIQLSAREISTVKIAQSKVIGLATEEPEYRILVVDDQDDNRLLLLDLLTPVGFSVKQAINGLEAIKIWQEWQPHLIWMDLRMPEMDGYVATQKIRERESELSPQGCSTKIIALTANVFKEEQDKALKSGFDDFVIKPFQEETIWQKMVLHLGIKLIYEPVPQLNNQTLAKIIDEQAVVHSTDISSDLQTMSSEWLAKLQEACIQLKGKKVMQLIKAIPTEKTALVAHLKTLAENYQFDEILRLLKLLSFSQL